MMSEAHEPNPHKGEPPSPLSDLNRKLRLEVQRWQARGRDPTDVLRGLYVDDKEARELADSASVAPPSGWSELIFQRLARLTQLFGLRSHESQILLATVAPDLDLRYQRLYAYLQDDMTLKRPTPDLLLRLLVGSAEERLALRGLFGPSGRLLRLRLIGRQAPAEGEGAPLLDRALRSDERVVTYLLGSEEVDERLRLFTRLLPNEGQTMFTPPWPEDRLATTLEACQRAVGRPCLVVLDGPSGVGKTQAAQWIAGRLGAPVLHVDATGLKNGQLGARVMAGLALREAALQESVLYCANAAALWEEGEGPATAGEALLHELAGWGGIVFLAGPLNWAAPAAFARLGAVRLSLPMPDTRQRIPIWQEELALEPNVTELLGVVPILASSFRLTRGQVRDALMVARTYTSERDSKLPELSSADLFAACRAVSSRALTEVAVEITRHASWNELVLPPDPVAQLEELCATVRWRGTVLDGWGFANKITGGTGITALFAGPSGTGKTMAAGVVAAELGLPIFRIDLARIVSKWIGETEKNLERVFRSAEDSNAVLFLDEAEALLGKRSEVKDSHDRYANLEISYLLQKMELYDGVAILATNMPQLIDEAFVRRLAFTITFPMPDELERYRIWETIWPEKLPRAKDVDLEQLARFRLAGGHIKNVLLAAAYLAASQASPVTMAHLRHGLRREYQKLGKEFREVVA